jgi:hypothetical protein
LYIPVIKLLPESFVFSFPLEKMKIYRTMILPALLYGCAFRFLTVREEHGLNVSESRMLRRIFGPKREEVAGGWRRLHNEELRNLYASPNIIRVGKSRRMRWAGHVARMRPINTHTKFRSESRKGREHSED